MRIVEKAVRGVRTWFEHQFDWEEGGGGYGFKCDEDGTIEVDSMNEVIADKYRACLTGVVNGERVIDRGIVKRSHRYFVPPIGECDDCGSLIYLDTTDNECHKCGAIYNCLGQRLAPREQWGEETGEVF